MSAWATLAAAMRARHPGATDAGDHLRIVLVSAAPDRVRIGVRLRLVGEAVELVADLGPMARFDPWEVLRTNAALAHGALAMIGETAVLRAVAPMAIPVEELAVRVQRLAGEAAAIRGPQVPADATVFAHYAA
ncbi:MAG: hypothetical protein K8W52_35960 [Deltaproteobacteria bacterium]|nr:hypothetical protein [Deltaproteobacteria bacterium]